MLVYPANPDPPKIFDDLLTPRLIKPSGLRACPLCPGENGLKYLTESGPDCDSISEKSQVMKKLLSDPVA